jgi:hypothetical protein
MGAYHYYVLYGGCYACYLLGMMHSKGQASWLKWGLCMLTGAIWPAAVLYGIYLAHFAEAAAQQPHDQESKTIDAAMAVSQPLTTEAERTEGE